MSRAPRALIAFLLLALLVSCSEDDPAAPESAPTGQVTKTIPPTGGSLSIADENGARCTVDVPSGAILAAKSMTLRAVDAPSGVRARFALEPAGLALLVPATITVELPDGAAIDESFGLSFVSGESVPVPTEVDPVTRTLQVSTHYLGFDLPAPSGASTFEIAAADGDEFIDVEDFECQLIRDSLTDAILRAQAFVGAFPPNLATPLIQQYQAALLVCESADSVAGATDALRDLACTNVTSAESQAQSVLIESVDDFRNSLGALLAAEGLAQVTGADCHVQSSSIESEFVEYINSYIARIEDPAFTASFATWDALWRQLVPVTSLLAMAQEYGVPAAQEKIETELMPTLFARLHEVALAACEEDENSGLLSDILSGGHKLNHPITPAEDLPPFSGFSKSELLDQFHRCGSHLHFEARSPQGDVIDETRVGENGGTTGTVTVIKDGRIAITDDLLGLMCGDVLARDVVRVLAALPGQLPTVPLGTLDGDRVINVASTLSALPGDEVTDFDLVFERNRKQCGIDDGVPTIELYRVTVRVLGAAGSGGGTWEGTCPNDFEGGGTYSFAIDNDGNVTGTFAGDASGTISGVVTGSGTFNAAANGTAGGCTWSGTLSGFGDHITGSGTWTCDSGCSGTWTSGGGD
jgi:hypothetical protein